MFFFAHNNQTEPIAAGCKLYLFFWFETRFTQFKIWVTPCYYDDPTTRSCYSGKFTHKLLQVEYQLLSMNWKDSPT
jgi:hypothetical protein